MFNLTKEQLQILREFAADHTADQDFVEWHQEQKKSSDDFKKILKERKFDQGGDLSPDELYEVGRLLSVGLGSTVLGMRGKYSPFEANDAKAFNARLRDMLYSSEDLGHRIDNFLDMRYVGVQTVSQFLCKFDHEKYPFFANYMLSVFEYLLIDEAQRIDARRQADQEFKLGSDIRHDRTHEYLQYFMILREIKNALGLEDYLKTQNLLWRLHEWLEENEVNAHYIEEKKGFQIDENIVKDEHRGVIFGAGELCFTLERDYGIPFQAQAIEGWTDEFEGEAAKYLQGMRGRTADATPIALSLEELSGRTYLPMGFLKGLESLLLEKRQVILYGPPGTGKTFISEEMALYLAGSKERVAKVQFHPSYSYEDFVEGLKPKLSEGKLTYDVIPGTFKKFCGNAISSPERHVFIIDEINRGNIAKVFGELIYCLEYRDRDITLPNSEEKFRIPSNLYIIATMNSADRSIALVDYALRRRFYFEELHPDASVLSKYLTENKCTINADALVAFFNKINDRVEQKLGKEYTVGHSYFMIRSMDKDKASRVWKYAVYPLLEEYFFHNKSELEEFEKDFAEFISSI